MFRGRAAASADQIDEAAVHEVADGLGHLFGGLVVVTKFVGEAGVRMHAHERRRDLRERLDVGPQGFGPEGAVQADNQRLGVANRVPERFRGLTRQGTTAGIGYRAGNHYRQALPASREDVTQGI